MKEEKEYQVQVESTKTTEMTITVTADDKDHALLKAKDWDYEEIDTYDIEQKENWAEAEVSEVTQ